MLKKLILSNFRRHSDLTLNFGLGLNALRGANESGKSTINEAILYALYGSTALRTSLAETATWGMQDKDLAVELTLSLNGTDLRFTRSKAGATVYRGSEIHVTGQREVSAFAAEMLGADAKTATMLMMAGQADLRGALAEGPSAVSALIGKLADFDLIDRLLERAQASLLLGADAPLRERLKQAEAQIVTATAGVPADMSTQRADAIHALVGEAALLTSNLDDLHRPVAKLANEELLAANAQMTSRANAAAQLGVARSQITQLDARLVTAKATAANRPATGAIDAARAVVAGLMDLAAKARHYDSVAGLPAYPETHWEGDAASFAAEVKDAEALCVSLDRDIAEAGREITRLQRTTLGDGKCPTCGSATADPEHIRKHNEAVAAQVAAAQKAQAAKRELLTQARVDRAALLAVEKAAGPFVEAVRTVPAEYLDVNLNFYPPRVRWAVGPVQAGADPVAARAEISRLQALEQQALRAEGEALSIEGSITQAREAAWALEQRVADLPEIDLKPLNARAAAAQDALQANERALAQVTADVQRFTQLAQVEKAQRDQAVAAVAALGQRVEELTADIETLGFNNALMKTLKGLKPLVTDRLWSIVLSSVSAFFSQIRGEASVVTKDNGGFKVNGYAVESLSGSTLDALAIAVRVALTKTFIPQAPFLILDEPAHGCDNSRTGNILGFLAGSGFTQLLVASHDELSESVADHVICLGS